MRKYSLDICRIFACLLVVMCHTLMLFWDFDPSSPVWAVYNFIALIIRCCIPLFFMISGALILHRKHLELRKHYLKALHFIVLYFVWSFICAFIDNSLLHVWYQNADMVSMLLGSYYHLWYLPAIAMCYCLLPLVYVLIHKDAHIAISQILLPIILLVVLGIVFPDKFVLADLKYILCIVLGWYLFEHRLNNKQLVLLAIAAAVSLLIFAELNRRYSISIGEASTKYYGKMSIAMLLLSSLVFSLCLRINTIPAKLHGMLEEFSACTLGIYLVHPLFISGLKSLHLDFTQFNTFIFFPMCFLSFVLLSLLTSWLLRRIPLLKKLIT